MRNLFRLVLGCAVLVTLLMSCARGEALYLRVVGRDDSPAAQMEKLRVRNAALSVLPTEGIAPWALVPVVRDAVAPVADCRVEARRWSPGRGAPPAPTLLVTVGQGAGHHWWGVLYPDARRWAQVEDDTSDEENDSAPVVFLWPFWDWLCRLFSGR